MTWVVLALCQLAVTVAGNLAVIPLTGVTFPFVSFGLTSLVVNMSMLGLADQRSMHEGRGRECLNARRLTLLQLAIAASTAVVPVLLVVLLIVASARLADDTKPRAQQRSAR